MIITIQIMNHVFDIECLQSRPKNNQKKKKVGESSRYSQGSQ